MKEVDIEAFGSRNMFEDCCRRADGRHVDSVARGVSATCTVKWYGATQSANRESAWRKTWQHTFLILFEYQLFSHPRIVTISFLPFAGYQSLLVVHVCRGTEQHCATHHVACVRS